MATRVNIYIDQGTDFGVSISVNEADGTPLFDSNVEFFSSTRKVFSVTKQFDFLVSSGEAPGSISIELPAEVSANIDPGKYEYDILMRTEDNNIFKVLEGLVFVIPTMTKIGANT